MIINPGDPAHAQYGIFRAFTKNQDRCETWATNGQTDLVNLGCSVPSLRIKIGVKHGLPIERQSLLLRAIHSMAPSKF